VVHLKYRCEKRLGGMCRFSGRAQVLKHLSEKIISVPTALSMYCTRCTYVVHRRLEKGSFVRFQPLSRGFHEAVGEHVKPILEQALMQYSALTVGDIVRVDALGAEYALKV
jgi:hypothetical protein